MTKILIHKPLWKTLFNEEDNSKIFVNPEPKNLALILAKEHEVVFSSDCDLTYEGNPRKMKNLERFDKKILLNGRLYFKGDELDEKVRKEIEQVKLIFDNKVPQYHFITDLKIVDRNQEVLKNVELKNISQSKNVGEWGELEKLFLYHNLIDLGKEKESKLIYIGNERNNQRTDLVKKYLLENDFKTEIYGKWSNPIVVNDKNFKGSVHYKNSQSKLKRVKYGICITDKMYRDKGFITPRYFEYLLSGNIAFCDKNYDKDELVIKKDDFRIVDSKKELINKIIFLDKHPKVYKHLLDIQTNEILFEYTYGSHQLNVLNKILKGG